MNHLSTNLEDRSILFLMHGIMSGTSDIRWPDTGERMAHEERPDLIVLKERYFAGPFPRMTALIANRRQTRLAVRRAAQYPPNIPVHIAAHSNGCVIAMKTADELVKQGRKVGKVILMQAALPSKAETLYKRYPHAMGMSGPWIEAWGSPNDRIVGRWIWPFRWMRWPWGDLGGVGLQPGDLPQFKTVMDPKHNHGSRTKPPEVFRTIRQIFDAIPKR